MCYLIKQIVRKTKGEVIAFDGKQSRASYDRHQKKSALHMISAWASKNRLFTQMEEPGYMLFTAMLIGLQWQKDNIQKTVH